MIEGYFILKDLLHICGYCGDAYDPETLKHLFESNDDHWPGVKGETNG